VQKFSDLFSPFPAMIPQQVKFISNHNEVGALEGLTSLLGKRPHSAICRGEEDGRLSKMHISSLLC
jgi:hypothetical protein